MYKQLRNLLILFVLIVACESESVDPVANDPMTPDQNEPVDMDPDDDSDDNTNQVTFSKADGADSNVESNQDRITDNVWITRGNNGGQIFNIRENSSASKNNSPVGTEWAMGTTDDLANLTFRSFRSTIRPSQVVGEELVLHLIEDDIYLNVMFTDWSSNKGGGFAYTRDEVPE